MQISSISSLLLLVSALALAAATPTGPDVGIEERDSHNKCKSGKPFTGQAGCSKCKVRGNVVCGRDEDKITDLKCTLIGRSLVWVPINNPRKCGVAKREAEPEAEPAPEPVPEPVPQGNSKCKSGKPFTGQAGCSKCKVRGNVVCGRDEDKITDLKCTRIGNSLVWVPINNPRKCGVAKREAEPEAEPAPEPVPEPVPQGNSKCKSGKPFTGQAGCSKCKVKGNVVCGRDEDKITDLKCTLIGRSLVWVPVNNPRKCGVAKRDAEAEPEPAAEAEAEAEPAGIQEREAEADASTTGYNDCKSGKPFTGQAGCSACKVENNIVCGRDEDKITDLKCKRIGYSLTWVPINNPHKCGV